MDNTNIINLINETIDQKLNSMSNMATPNHVHNTYDSNQLDPAISLLGFPVIQVADATVAPTDIPTNGIFRFYVDFNHGGSGVARYYLWAYINYQNTTTSTLVGVWKSVALT